MHQVHTLNLGCTHRLACLLSLLYATIQPSLPCACSAFYMPRYSQAYCVPAQPSICHNTAKPTVCLLSLLYATIQPSLLCACLAFYMPQYSRAYYMPAQPSIVCLLSLLYATIQPSLLCACSAFYMAQYNTSIAIQIFFFQPAYNTILSLQYTSSLSFK